MQTNGFQHTCQCRNHHWLWVLKEAPAHIRRPRWKSEPSTWSASEKKSPVCGQRQFCAGRRGAPGLRNAVCTDFVSAPWEAFILPPCLPYTKKVFLYLLINLTVSPEPLRPRRSSVIHSHTPHLLLPSLLPRCPLYGVLIWPSCLGISFPCLNPGLCCKALALRLQVYYSSFCSNDLEAFCRES